MKRTKQILILLLFVQLNSQAQYKSIFGKQSTEWIFEWNNLFGTAQDTLIVTKDTIAFNIIWKKIEIKRKSNLFKGALIREDTTIGKVWFKSLDYSTYDKKDTLEYELFNFGLSLNDTFNIKSPSYTLISSEKRVDSVYYNNGSKHIRFAKNLFQNEKPLFIEGIGSNLNLLYQLPNGMMNQYLICSYKDGIQTFYRNQKYIGSCISPMLGFEKEKFEINVIDIYPNPNHGIFTVEIGSNNKDQSYQVFVKDGYGRLVYQTSIDQKTNNVEINLSPLTKGVYFVTLVSKNTYITRKVIIY